jgi:hypothetical protein
MHRSCFAALGRSREVDTAAVGVAARKGGTTSEVGAAAFRVVRRPRRARRRARATWSRRRVRVVLVRPRIRVTLEEMWAPMLVLVGWLLVLPSSWLQV